MLSLNNLTRIVSTTFALSTDDPLSNTTGQIFLTQSLASTLQIPSFGDFPVYFISLLLLLLLLLPKID